MARPLLPLLGVGGSAVATAGSIIGTPMGLLLALTYAADPVLGITFVGAGAVDTGIAGITCGLPAGFQANDIHLLLLNCRSDDSFAAPSGWTAVTGSPVAATTNPKLTVYWRRAQGGDASVAVAEPTPAGDHAAGVVLGFRGVITTGDPWEAVQFAAQDTASTAGVISGVPSLTNNAMCVSIITSVGSDTIPQLNVSYSAFANVSLQTTTEAVDGETSSGAGGAIGAAYGIKQVAGAVSNTTVTLATSSRYVHAMIILKPAP